MTSDPLAKARVAWGADMPDWVALLASACAGAALCFGLRMAAIRYGWHLPVARASKQAALDAEASEGRDGGR